MKSNQYCVYISQRLPISDRDEDGKLTEDLGWQTTEVKLSLNDVNLKSALGLN